MKGLVDLFDIVPVLMGSSLVGGVACDDILVSCIRISDGAHYLESAIENQEEAKAEADDAMREALEKIGPENPIAEDEELCHTLADLTYLAEEEIEEEVEQHGIDEHDILGTDGFESVPENEYDQTCAQSFERTDGEAEAHIGHVTVAQICVDHELQLASDERCDGADTHREDRYLE